MASAAEQMAANISLANFTKATDLKKRLWFTLGALIVFRLLGKGAITAKLAFKVAGVSKGAREAVEKAGGSIELIERKDPAALAAAKKGKVREKRLADQASAKAEA